MIIEPGFYRTRDGHRVCVAAVRDDVSDGDAVIGWMDGGPVQSWSRSGAYLPNTPPSEYDLVAVWREPFKKRTWANVYSANNNVSLHENEDDARRCLGGSGRTVTVEITEVLDET